MLYSQRVSMFFCFLQKGGELSCCADLITNENRAIELVRKVRFDCDCFLSNRVVAGCRKRNSD